MEIHDKYIQLDKSFVWSRGRKTVAMPALFSVCSFEHAISGSTGTVLATVPWPARNGGKYGKVLNWTFFRLSAEVWSVCSNIQYDLKKRQAYSYCWWFRNPKQPPGMYKTPMNIEISTRSTAEFTGFPNHQPNLCGRFSVLKTIFSSRTVSCCFSLWSD